MKKLVQKIQSSVLALLATGTLFASHAEALELVVPAYFYPSSSNQYWGALASAAVKTPTTVIANPASGPGTSLDNNYVTAITKVRQAGGKVIGYVHTSYAARSISDVTADIQKYLSWYAIDGFFIDEMSNDNFSAHIQYYQSLYNYIKGLNASFTVIGNPGATTQEIYLTLPTADKLVVFENSQKAFNTFVPSTWQANYPASRFVYMVYNATRTQMLSDITKTASQNAGSVYITNDKLPNPYDVLPGYWADEVNAAATH